MHLHKKESENVITLGQDKEIRKKWLYVRVIYDAVTKVHGVWLSPFDLILCSRAFTPFLSRI